MRPVGKKAVSTLATSAGAVHKKGVLGLKTGILFVIAGVLVLALLAALAGTALNAAGHFRRGGAQESWTAPQAGAEPETAMEFARKALDGGTGGSVQAAEAIILKRQLAQLPAEAPVEIRIAPAPENATVAPIAENTTFADENTTSAKGTNSSLQHEGGNTSILGEKVSETGYRTIAGMPVYPLGGDFRAEAAIKTSDSADAAILSSVEGDFRSYWTVGKAYAGNGAVLIIKVNGGDGEDSGTGSTNLADGKQHAVAFVRDHAAGRIYGYVDGNLEIDMNDLEGEIGDLSQVIMVGASGPEEGDTGFRGTITDVTTYSNMLGQVTTGQQPG
jgi:hypothetical protein